MTYRHMKTSILLLFIGLLGATEGADSQGWGIQYLDSPGYQALLKFLHRPPGHSWEVPTEIPSYHLADGPAPDTAVFNFDSRSADFLAAQAEKEWQQKIANVMQRLDLSQLVAQKKYLWNNGKVYLWRESAALFLTLLWKLWHEHPSLLWETQDLQLSQIIPPGEILQILFDGPSREVGVVKAALEQKFPHYQVEVFPLGSLAKDSWQQLELRDRLHRHTVGIDGDPSAPQITAPLSALNLQSAPLPQESEAVTLSSILSRGTLPFWPRNDEAHHETLILFDQGERKGTLQRSQDEFTPDEVNFFEAQAQFIMLASLSYLRMLAMLEAPISPQDHRWLSALWSQYPRFYINGRNQQKMQALVFQIVLSTRDVWRPYVIERLHNLGILAAIKPVSCEKYLAPDKIKSAQEELRLTPTPLTYSF
jgi:hypothetical protein